MSNGNGDYKWFVASDMDSEHWHGPEDTREAAIQVGRQDYGNEAFAICRADKAVAACVPDMESFAETMMESIGEANEDCWSEDGWEDAWTDAAFKELRNRLESTVGQWLKDFPAKTYMFGDTQMEAIPAIEQVAA